MDKGGSSGFFDQSKRSIEFGGKPEIKLVCTSDGCPYRTSPIEHTQDEYVNAAGGNRSWMHRGVRSD